MSETQRGPTPQTPGSLLMNVHGDGAGHFTELRLMEGEQGAKCRPRVAAQARSRSVLSVLLTETKGGWTIASTSLIPAPPWGSQQRQPQCWPQESHVPAPEGCVLTTNDVMHWRLGVGHRTLAASQALVLNLTKSFSGVSLCHRGYLEPGVPSIFCTQDNDGLSCV